MSDFAAAEGFGSEETQSRARELAGEGTANGRDGLGGEDVEEEEVCCGGLVCSDDTCMNVTSVHVVMGALTAVLTYWAGTYVHLGRACTGVDNDPTARLPPITGSSVSPALSLLLHPVPGCAFSASWRDEDLEGKAVQAEWLALVALIGALIFLLTDYALFLGHARLYIWNARAMAALHGSRALEQFRRALGVFNIPGVLFYLFPAPPGREPVVFTCCLPCCGKGRLCHRRRKSRSATLMCSLGVVACVCCGPASDREWMQQNARVRAQ
jgi:hypothetical protein